MNRLYGKMKTTSSKNGLMGAFLAAAAASICCIGPLIVIGFGVGGAWASGFSFFEPIRPYLLVLTAGLLGYSFYRIYWKAKTEECEPGAVCADPRTTKINKISLWTVTILVILMFSVPYIAPSLYASETGSTGTGKSIQLDVSGMTCTSCEHSFEALLTSMDGVSDVKANYENGSAVLKYDSTKVSLDKVLSESTKIGYKSTLTMSDKGDKK